MTDSTLPNHLPTPDRFTSKPLLGQFLAKNPFSRPLMLGFFYREKMRAIHKIAPDLPFQSVLEVGGGQGGLTALLYPKFHITNRSVCLRRCHTAPVLGQFIRRRDHV